jgi:hypothetical protein
MRAIELHELAGRAPWWLRYQRARARLELAEFATLEAELDDLAQTGTRTQSRAATALRAVMLLRAQRYEEALQAAIAGLQDVPRPRWQAELAAVRFEAAHRLGLPCEAGNLSADQIDILRRQGYGEWVDRLVMEYGLAPTGRP